ncbi:hypothetical protein IT418_00080 [bacterium]|nr:hypothetical protein [bacterium]
MIKKSSLQARLKKFIKFPQDAVIGKNIELVYKVVCSIDDICNAKKGGRVKRHNLLALFVAGQFTQEAGDLLQKIIRDEQKLPKLERTFPDLLGDIATFRNKETTTLPGLFTTTLLFSNWSTKSDLKQDLKDLGNLLVKATVLVPAMKLVKESSYKKTQVDTDRIGFIYLRELANTLHIAATTTPLPEVEMSKNIGNNERQKIVESVRRFSVDKQVHQQYTQIKEQLTLLLEDIKDFLVDYPKSEIRLKGFKQLSFSCRKYLSIL